MNVARQRSTTLGDRARAVLIYLWRDYSVLIALILMVVIASVLNPRFLTFRNLANILRQVSVIGIVAMGMTLVILSGGIDLSVGSVLALSGVIGMLTLNSSDSVILGVVVTIAMGAALGGFNGLLITKGRVAPFIATLGMMAVARSLSMFIIRGGNVVGTVDGYALISRGTLFGLRYPVYFFISVSLFVWFLTTKTRFGRHLYATGSNERATRLSAVNVDRVKLGVYMLCSALVAVGAVVESATLNSISSSNSGMQYELDAIAAVIIGGTRLEGGRGKVIGTILGVLLLGVLNNVLNLMNVSPFLQGFVKGLIIITAVFVQRRD